MSASRDHLRYDQMTMNRFARSTSVVLFAALGRPTGAAAPSAAPVVNNGISALARDTGESCPDIHFVAYSTLETGGQRFEESINWDAVNKAYVIRGPMFANLLNDPGVERIPSDEAIAQTVFQIAVRKGLSNPVDRVCEYNFQESAQCDVHGNIVYTQIYTGCDQQTLQHVTKIQPDSAGTLQLIDLSFANVSGEFSIPLYLAAGSDLRLRIRN